MKATVNIVLSSTISKHIHRIMVLTVLDKRSVKRIYAWDLLRCKHLLKRFRIRAINIILFAFAFYLNTTCTLLRAQTLASNNTRAQARYNKEKSYADSQRKTFRITSWAGANISDLFKKWGSYTKKNVLPNGIVVYIFEYNFSGSGGSYTPGYVVTDQFGNVLEKKAAKDKTYSYNFTDYYRFFVDKNQIIIHVKIGS